MRPYRYPNCILPKKQYKNRIDLEALAYLKHCCVVRTSNFPFHETFNVETCTLKERVILEKDIPGLSMNLMGGRLHLRHLKFRPNGKAMLLWDKNKPEIPKIKVYSGQHFKSKIALPIFFYLSEINNQPFPYYKHKDPEVTKFYKALGKMPKAIDNERYELEGLCIVKHSPNKLNYWHVEIDLRDFSNKHVDYSSKGWKFSAAQLAYLNIISISAIPYIEKWSTIPKDKYLDVA